MFHVAGGCLCFLLGLCVNLFMQVPPEEAVSNLGKWARALGINPPPWFDTPNTAKIVKRMAIGLMIIGPVWAMSGTHHEIVGKTHLSRVTVQPLILSPHDLVSSDFWFQINGKRVPGHGQKSVIDMQKTGTFSLSLYSRSKKELSDYTVSFSVSGCNISSVDPRWQVGHTTLDKQAAQSLLFHAPDRDIPVSSVFPHTFPDINYDCLKNVIRIEIGLYRGNLRKLEAAKITF